MPGPPHHGLADPQVRACCGVGWGGRIRTFDLLIQSQETDFGRSGPLRARQSPYSCLKLSQVAHWISAGDHELGNLTRGAGATSRIGRPHDATVVSRRSRLRHLDGDTALGTFREVVPEEVGHSPRRRVHCVRVPGQTIAGHHIDDRASSVGASLPYQPLSHDRFDLLAAVCRHPEAIERTRQDDDRGGERYGVWTCAVLPTEALTALSASYAGSGPCVSLPV